MFGSKKTAHTQRETQEVKQYRGFSSTGSFISSEIPVENGTTRLAHDLVKQIREEFLSPQDVYFLVLRDGSKAFRPDTLGRWSQFSRFWQWPLTRAQTPLEEFVRSLGGKHPWLSDEFLWGHLCDGAEKKYGYESRMVDPVKVAELIQTIAR
jgi:hypothetical protein